MPSNLIELTFANDTNKSLYIWTEPLAHEIEIPSGYEYKIITDETHLRFEFEENNLTLWLEYRFGYKLLKRKKGGEWEVDLDTFDIQ